MLPLLLLSLGLTVATAQTDLSYYIARWKYKPLETPPKKTQLYILGAKLFSDQALSGKTNISCESCHAKATFSGDSLVLGLGEGATGMGTKRMQKDGLILRRHSMALYNTSLMNELFWDGRVSKSMFGGWSTPEPKLNGPTPILKDIADTLDSALAAQSIFPITSPEEMLGKNSQLTRTQAWDAALLKVLALHPKLFKQAYPGVEKFNIGHVGNALGEFIRQEFQAINTPWDLYLRGRTEMLNERMKRGAVLFHSRANCIFCHNGNQFTNFSYENIGIPQIYQDDEGRSAITKNTRDRYAFRVAPLRNVGVTAPYMHSGVFKTLREVIEHYSNPVASLRNFTWSSRVDNYRDPLNLDTDPVRHDNREKNMSAMLARKLSLNADEKDDLICFLAVALTDMSLQNELTKNGVVDEISDCSPRSL
jgi:cytochrome c peroxidase